MTVYSSEEAAFRRVDTLKRSGIWPGVRRVPGGWALTYDPEIIKGVADILGNYSELGRDPGHSAHPWGTRGARAPADSAYARRSEGALVMHRILP